jgi:sugar phosphate isomerase/epimerase
MTMRLSIQAIALSDDPREAVRLAREYHFEGLLFDAFSPMLNIPDLSATGRREFRHVLAGHNRQLVGLRAQTGKAGLGRDADIDRLLHQFERTMESAAGLSAPLVCLDIGPLPAPPREKKKHVPISPRQAGDIIVPSTLTAAPAPESTTLDSIPSTVDPVLISEIDGALAELCRLADRYNVTLALGSELSSFAALERAMNKSGCPWFGVNLCPVEVLRDEWSLDEIFSKLGSRIRHVRGCDAIRGANQRTKPATVGQGDTPWPQLLQNLEDSNYRGWLTLDPTELPARAAAAVAGQNYLRKIRGGT